MAVKPSRGDSDRPPTILSEYGEGYCRVCHFVIGLTWQGVLGPHIRGAHGLHLGDVGECKGSYKVPPKVTPCSSAKAMFRVTPTMAWCPDCKADVPTHLGIRGGSRSYGRHRVGPYSPVLCVRSFEPVV